MSTIGLGRSSVNGRSLSPRPPARTSAVQVRMAPLVYLSPEGEATAAVSRCGPAAFLLIFSYEAGAR